MPTVRPTSGSPAGPVWRTGPFRSTGPAGGLRCAGSVAEAGVVWAGAACVVPPDTGDVVGLTVGGTVVVAAPEQLASSRVAAAVVVAAARRNSAMRMGWQRTGVPSAGRRAETRRREPFAHGARHRTDGQRAAHPLRRCFGRGHSRFFFDVQGLGPGDGARRLSIIPTIAHFTIASCVSGRRS